MNVIVNNEKIMKNIKISTDIIHKLSPKISSIIRIGFFFDFNLKHSRDLFNQITQTNVYRILSEQSFLQIFPFNDIQREKKCCANKGMKAERNYSSKCNPTDSRDFVSSETPKNLLT